jgi:hypothetical protein
MSGNGEKLLTTEELAERWSVDPGTVDNWRKAKKGPPFVKLGKGVSAPVRYRLSDIEKYEQTNLKGAS